MNCIILGSNSDLAKSLIPHLFVDGYNIYGWARGEDLPMHNWDLLLVALGTVAPVGKWWESDGSECMESNYLLPIRQLRTLWVCRNKNASVCFLAGSNPNKIHIDYSAYSIAKMALLKACEHFDVESDTKFFAMNPGYVDTKIHRPSIDAGIDLSGRTSTPIERIYGCLKWAIAQDKSVIGGRNLCASDSWDAKNYDFAAYLKANPSMFKLRRVE